jgi:signal transduction histidine kinase
VVGPEQPSEINSWERWKADWQHAFFAVALSLTTLGAVVPSTDEDAAAIAVRLAMSALLGAWYVYWFALRRDSTAAHLPYLLGAAGLWALMTAVDPAMLLVGVAALVPYCMRHLRATAAAAIALGALWLWQRQVTGGGLDWSSVLGCALGILAVATIAGYIAILDREGRRRQRLLDELSAAQAELAAAERQAGTLAERQRLARDIHDTLTQGFASISMLLDAALADLPPNDSTSRRVTQAMRTARENLAESRRLVEALRPVQLDGTRLPEAVRLLTSRLRDETGLAAHTVITGDAATLEPAVETALLRVVQEALSNVRRHAAARQVTVTISYLDDVVVVDVHDDGSGFEPSARPCGVGLAAMRERVQDHAGTLTIESAPGEGTTIAVTVPVTATPQPHRQRPETGRTPADHVPAGQSLAAR